MAEYTHSLANQMKMRDREMVPRILVIAMFGLMALTLAIVTFARLTEQPLRGVPAESAIVAERPITLIGARSGGVTVEDANGTEIAWSFKDKAGFIDVIWVSVARERKVQGITGNPPLRLVRRANGHTAIIDPATGWSIELIGYGQDNIAAFARLLD
ncbi:putative photosynthetic complex assembly protein [Sulfitobacter noctilucicola]|uniref:Putative photosynthetic complex assembly protein n=1 Tax=Sulfitobacter noctilucicola TaxID=1342301 RepID=A0A7W6Q570_9RHOB|nr:photosynthetic complex assembly protein PuhC [Sulfitobacter noctilucicola]KIN69968.1 putative photosynthetic complex assembly protein [Sulfitobacter noctilucicola]MBB4176075.1 putative photosynthetic complex assembly protein [Sulfitobacter noctilucicola]